MQINCKNELKMARLLLIFGVIFLMFQYGIRVSLTGVLNERLLQYFSLTASGFGSLVSVFFFTYMLMQIPAGIISDHFDTKVTLLGAFALTFLGIAIFIATKNFFIAAAAQLIVGVGASFAFVLIFKITNTYFSKERAAFLASIAIACGNLGPVIISPNVAWISEKFFWRNVIFSATFLGILITVIGYFLIDEQKLKKINSSETLSSYSVKDSIKIICKNPQFFLVGSFSMLILGPATAFCDVWGVPFLKSAYGISTTQASSVVSFAYIGMIFGCPIVIWLANKMHSYKFPMIYGATSLFLLFLAIIFFKLPSILLIITLFLIGLMATSEFLAFPVAISMCPTEISATVTGFVNMITMHGCTVMIKLVGALIDFFALKFALKNGVSKITYSFQDYQYAMISIAAAVMCAIFVAFFVRDNYENGKK